MRRLSVLLTILALGVTALHAQNPDDIVFHVRLTKDPPEYRIGEPVTFEISLSSSAVKKYYARWTSLIPTGGIHVSVEPSDGVADLNISQTEVVSILGSFGYLTSKPVIETGDLTEWYRFQKPGRFRLSLAVDWVSRVTSAEEGGGKQPLKIESDSAEFEILARDPVWEAQELASILDDADNPANAQDVALQQRALHRLELLQSPAAAEEATRRYLAGAGAQFGYNPYYSVLLRSSQPDEIIPALESALANPSIVPPSGLVDLLTALQVRKQIGELPPQPSDPAKLADWQKTLKKSAKLSDDYFASYSKTLLSTLRLRAGPERLQTEFEAWSNAERQYGSADPPPEILSDLRADLLNASQDLSPNQQSQFLTDEWSKLPHVTLLPLIRRIALSQSPGPWSRDWAFQFWCQDWPEDCTEAILRELRKPASDLPLQTILLLPEHEHPELDSLLAQKLTDATAMNGQSPTLTAATILRAGSKNLLAAVTAFLDKRPPAASRDCQVEGYLMGYLFRVSKTAANQRSGAILQDASPYCGTQLLHALTQAMTASAAVPMVTAALNSANLTTAGAAALFLGEHGSEPARAALQQRLEQLHNQWQARAAEIRSAVFDDGIQWKAAQLEQDLVCAIVRGKAWNVTAAEKDSLASGCFTDQCRAIAQGTSWLSL